MKPMDKLRELKIIYSSICAAMNEIYGDYGLPPTTKEATSDYVTRFRECAKRFHKLHSLTWTGAQCGSDAEKGAIALRSLVEKDEEECNEKADKMLILHAKRDLGLL